MSRLAGNKKIIIFKQIHYDVVVFIEGCAVQTVAIS